MGFMLGNKTISDIECDHGFRFTDEEREFLHQLWEDRQKVFGYFYEAQFGLQVSDPWRVWKQRGEER